MAIPVVGVGASAGGLESFASLLAHLPANTGLAFVFVQHLDRRYHSNLTDILARVSAIPVQQATDGMEIEPNHLYVIPPDAGLEIANRALRITPCPLVFSGPHLPIDQFFRSLARECGSLAIGVILSGAGSDGADGIEAVKAAGGVTFVQDPATAKFDSMPQAAIASGCVDFALSPEVIAGQLTRLGGHPGIAEDEDSASGGSGVEGNSQFDPILALLRNATDVDFALYRETTIRRRILRRVALSNVGTLEEYRAQLEKDPGELNALYRDLLISVTRFFRNPESFEHLKKLVFPRLVQDDRPVNAPIRIWVPGCSTGEEAYSIAICLKDYFEETARAYPVQIFASDVSSAAIEKARNGIYAESIASDISPQRLNRYFLKVEGGYQIDKSLREMVVFSRHDLTRDPPFSKLDLISCRNVLIFLGSVRKNILALFYYALKPEGFLVLGTSEAEPGTLFSIVEGDHNIYTKNEAVATRQTRYAAGATCPRRSIDVYSRAAEIQAEDLKDRVGMRRELERILSSRYSGVGVVVNEALEVLEVFGQAAPYLSLPPGEISLNLLKLIPEARLVLEVEKLVSDVRRTGEAARSGRIPYKSGGAGSEVNIEVLPVGAQTHVLLVLFQPAPAASDIEPDANSDYRDREIAKLKQDLGDARQRLLSIIEERQLSEEESQNTTAEAISTNEELLSLNEELETAKEELQSTNEELTTMNRELQSNNAALTEARDFAMLIIATSATPLLVLDVELRITTANPAFYRAFGLSAGEAKDRLLFSISDGSWDIPRLRDLLQHILPENKVVQDFEIEQDFPGVGHRVLVLNARQLDGLQQILLGIDDVTERKERATAALYESEERFRYMADTAPVMIWVAGTDKGCTFFNKSWLAFTGRTMQQELGDGWALSLHPDDRDRCLDNYSSSFYARLGFQLETRLRRADGEYRWVLWTGVPRFAPNGIFAGYIGSCIDVTEVRRSQEEQLARQKLERVGTLAGGIAHDFNNILGGILAHSELALAQLGSGSHPEEELQKIRAVATRGAEIVRQLLTYSGQETEVVELVDVSRIVEDVLELLKVSVSKHAAVETDLGKDLPGIRGNPAQVRQIVMNLILNASEAIGDQDGVIRVTTRLLTMASDSPVAAAEGLAKRDYLQLEVSDTGRGMTPELQARVFDPFFTTKSAGHGLGLAVVQAIVRSLGGTIRLVSAPRKGTTLRIWLPCAEEARQAADNTTAPSPREEAPELRQATVLVVEDVDLLRQAVSRLLQKSGFSVIEAADGTAALDLIRGTGDVIDVILLDITLPGASSREIFEEAMRLRPNTALIVTSANSQEMAAAALHRPVEHFIRKPFRLRSLVDLIQNVLTS
jgi:two-component system, chemotaxis family, CheB/CheR fusion protein